MSSTPPSDSDEKIHGLDPRALLACVGKASRTGEFLLTWVPPDVEEMAALFPQFEVMEMIGRGGMGAVYRARQPALDRMVALKILPVEAAKDAAFAGRFRTEARALARLQHAGIVTIHDSGQTPAGHLFFVMEYVEGTDLSDLLAAGPLPVADALRISRAVCDALEYAHGCGIVHRDIKPGNVLLRADGVVKVADFGLARLRGENPGAESSRLTLAGSALGTPAYMAPEQRSGGEVDGRADLFSLGTVLYEMLTGNLPHGAWQPASRKAGSSPRLDTVVEKALQADPAARFQTASEMRAQLERVPQRKAPSLRKKHLLTAGAVMLAVLVAGGFWLWRDPQSAVDVASPAPSSVPSSGASPGGKFPAGTLTPLAEVDLVRSRAFIGAWHWEKDVPGETLAIDFTQAPHPKVLPLPAQPGTQAYDVSAELWLENRGSDFSILSPAGHGRFALTLDLYDHSGIELIKGKSWKTNTTLILKFLPTGRFVPFKLTVRPQGERVAIDVHYDNQPLMTWEGLQSDLTLPENQAEMGLISERPTGLVLYSSCGGVRVRNMQVKIHP